MQDRGMDFVNMKKLNYKGYYIKLNINDDADVIQRLDEQKNRQGYIRELIRTDIALDVFREGVENGSIRIEKSEKDDKV